MPSFAQISPPQLWRLIGLPDAPAVIDVRIDEDFDADPRVIPTARRISHRDVESIVPSIAGKRAVVTCQRGLKLSQGAAALLRTHGVEAESLEGGHEAWVAGNLPLSEAARLGGTHLWVTRHRPKIDRIACPWLIRRFVAPSARFLYVAPGEVDAVAERFNATPYDIDGVHFSHEGPMCSFDIMLREFGLKGGAFERMALVIRGADTNRHDLHPAAAGLLALSVGLSRQFKDDLAQLEAGMMLYDALYRWARDGFDEGHDWVPEPLK